MSRGYRREREDADAVVHLADVVCIGETVRAIRVDIDGEERWVPKSVVHKDSEVWGYEDEDARGPGDLVVMEWWAVKEGLA